MLRERNTVLHSRATVDALCRLPTGVGSTGWPGCSVRELRDRGIYATRQLAKRQITWLRNTLRSEIVDCLAADAEERVAQLLGDILR
jgi:hypothetical protein